MAQKNFHRHFETKGTPLYWILFIYLILGWFFPAVGWLAVICMLGPILTSIWKGRWWCGHACPRGNMYDRLQMYFAWGDWGAMGRVFWNIIVLTTIVGIVLSFIYAPRTWCCFCPMGTISSWVAPKKQPLPKPFTRIKVDDSCQMKCKSCARVCPMQLTPYESRGNEIGFLHPDCLKCGKCTQACPSKIMTLKK